MAKQKTRTLNLGAGWPPVVLHRTSPCDGWTFETYGQHFYIDGSGDQDWHVYKGKSYRAPIWDDGPSLHKTLSGAVLCVCRTVERLAGDARSGAATRAHARREEATEERRQQHAKILGDKMDKVRAGKERKKQAREIMKNGRPDAEWNF